jgi:hypothetical protein
MSITNNQGLRRSLRFQPVNPNTEDPVAQAAAATAVMVTPVVSASGQAVAAARAAFTAGLPVVPAAGSAFTQCDYNITTALEYSQAAGSQESQLTNQIKYYRSDTIPGCPDHTDPQQRQYDLSIAHASYRPKAYMYCSRHNRLAYHTAARCSIFYHIPARSLARKHMLNQIKARFKWDPPGGRNDVPGAG